MRLRVSVGAIAVGVVLIVSVADFIHELEILRDPAQAVIAAMPTLIRSGTLVLGAYLVWRGFPRRTGRGTFCRRCGYHQEHQGRIVGECPECGAPWRWIGRFSIGRRSGVSWTVTVGCALLVVVLGSWLIRQSAPWLLLRWVPDDMLLFRLATRPDEELDDEWEELDRRAIPYAKLDKLAKDVARKKIRDGYVSRDAKKLVMASLVRASSPPVLSAQYFSRALSATMQGPDRVIEGDSAELRTQAVFVGGAIASSPGMRMEVMSALYVGSDTTPVRVWSWPIRSPSSDDERMMRHTISNLAAGKITVRQVFWLVIGRGSDEAITVNESGLVLPRGLGMYNTFELVHDIEVKARKRPAQEPSPGKIPP